MATTSQSTPSNFEAQDIRDAILAAHWDTLEAIHSSGFDWNAPMADDEEVVPLFIAARPDTYERFTVMKWLVEKGADINIEVDGSNIWNHISTKDDRYDDPDEGFDLGDMIALGADINKVSAFGTCLLRTAIIEGSIDVIEDYRRRGGKLDMKFDRLENAWVVAASRGNLKILQLLKANNVPLYAGLEQSDRDAENGWMSPLYCAMDDDRRPLQFNFRFNEEAMIQLLIECGDTLLDDAFDLGLEKTIDLVNADFGDDGFASLMDYAAILELQALPRDALLASVNSMRGARRVAAALNMSPEEMITLVSSQQMANGQHFIDALVAAE